MATDHLGKTCPYCQTPVKPTAQVVVCPECKMPHHRDCWQENGGCTTFGCSSRIVTTPATAAAPSLSPAPVTIDLTTAAAAPPRPRRSVWHVLGPILGIFGGLVVLAGATVIYLSFHRARENAKVFNCMTNQKQLATATQMYAQDHDETLPVSLEALDNYGITDDILQCPVAPGQAIGYGYNGYLIWQNVGAISAPTATLVTSDGGDSDHHLITSEVDLAATRHRGIIASYVDGHIDTISPGAQLTLAPPYPNNPNLSEKEVRVYNFIGAGARMCPSVKAMKQRFGTPIDEESEAVANPYSPGVSDIATKVEYLGLVATFYHVTESDNTFVTSVTLTNPHMLAPWGLHVGAPIDEARTALWNDFTSINHPGNFTDDGTSLCFEDGLEVAKISYEHGVITEISWHYYLD